MGSKAGSSLQTWEDKGWIVEQDPYGWVQWYCRFYAGRRSKDDERQIDRWNKYAGPKSGRCRKNLINKLKKAGADYDDPSVSPVIRQGLLQWAYLIVPDDIYKKKGSPKDMKIVHVTNDIIEYSGTLLTYGLVSCLVIFWHYKDKNYLIHASERTIFLPNGHEHQYHPLVEAFEQISLIPEKINVYIYSAVGMSDDEYRFLEKYDSRYNIIALGYNPLTEGLIGLTKDGQLVDEQKR